VGAAVRQPDVGHESRCVGPAGRWLVGVDRRLSGLVQAATSRQTSTATSSPGRRYAIARRPGRRQIPLPTTPPPGTSGRGCAIGQLCSEQDKTTSGPRNGWDGVGVGDDYYPLYGNGGYDVAHYLLKISYNPATDRLVGVATISARATETLCRFNLDFQGMTVRSVVVDGKRARWSRSQDHELTVTPRHQLTRGRRFTTMVRYDGVPRTQIDLSVPDEPLPYGWIHTDDGAVVVSEPEGSANWFPLNDHPTDKAAFTFVVTVPAGLQAISNGRLVGRRTHGQRTTWVWDAPDPMAPYLATATIGRFDLRRYRTARGLRMYDAVDPDLYDQPVDPQDPAAATFGELADGSLARRGEILGFLAGRFGPYPFSTGGGIVDDAPDLFFALENQTRPIYPGPSSPIRSTAISWWCTSSPTSGSGTAWPWPSGSTSGSTRASPPTPSGCGARTTTLGPPRRPSTSSTTTSPPVTRSGTWSSATRASRSSSTARCTCVVP
jgi:hypothetical protein